MTSCHAERLAVVFHPSAAGVLSSMAREMGLTSAVKRFRMSEFEGSKLCDT